MTRQPSYDDAQLACTLRACPVCGVIRWMHPDQGVCVRCQDAAAKAAK